MDLPSFTNIALPETTFLFSKTSKNLSNFSVLILDS